MSEKKQRSAAQIAAFEKAKAAREANMRKKFEEEQQQQKQAAEPITEPVQEQEPEEEECAEPPAPAPVEHAPTPRPAPQQVVHDDSDYIELDTEDLFNQLSDHKRELKELREHLHGLKQGHEELQSTWQQYRSGSSSLISFV